LLPDNVKVPDPTLVKVLAPLKTPEKVWLFPSPAVSAASVKSMVPAPSIDNTVSVASTSYVAPLATVTAVCANVPSTLMYQLKL
jgi:hypothetical protein